ncbi:MAG: hypothetical protein WC725_05165 [Patescibacteria group bacterium]|jgi:hypothetical protein
MTKSSFKITLLDAADSDADFAKTIIIEALTKAFSSPNSNVSFQIENSYRNIPNREYPDKADGIGNWCIKDICNHFNISEELVNNQTFYEQALTALEQVENKADADWEALDYYCNEHINKCYIEQENEN